MQYNRTAFRREVESAVTVFVHPAKTYTPSRNYQTLAKVGPNRSSRGLEQRPAALAVTTEAHDGPPQRSIGWRLGR